jgi:large subunit ribosomal protein L9
MKIILQHNVQKLGNEGDVVEVAPGYFRNFLQPRKMAVLATTGTLKKREEDLAILKKKAELAHQADLQLADRIKQIGTIRIGAKTGEGGKLFGKVTSKEIAAGLMSALNGTEIDRRIIKISKEIHSIGTYETVLKISHDVQAEINVEVFSEGSAEGDFGVYSEAQSELSTDSEHSETETEPELAGN